MYFETICGLNEKSLSHSQHLLLACAVAITRPVLVLSIHSYSIIIFLRVGAFSELINLPAQSVSIDKMIAQTLGLQP